MLKMQVSQNGLKVNVTKHLTLLLFIGLTWGQNTTSFSANDYKDSDKLVQSFRSDMGKYYTITYSGEFLGQKSNKVYFKPINDAPMKLLPLKEVKELKVDNKVLIKNGKWEIESESIKPYRGAFIDIEELNKKKLNIREKAVIDAKNDSYKEMAQKIAKEMKMMIAWNFTHMHWAVILAQQNN